jgi:hypothetical protein
MRKKGGYINTGPEKKITEKENQPTNNRTNIANIRSPSP